MKQAEMSDTEIKNCEKLARKMPQWDDVVSDMYKNNPSLAIGMLENEIKEYEETGDISYVLKTIERIAQSNIQSGARIYLRAKVSAIHEAAAQFYKNYA